MDLRLHAVFDPGDEGIVHQLRWGSLWIVRRRLVSVKGRCHNSLKCFEPAVYYTPLRTRRMHAAASSRLISCDLNTSPVITDKNS